MKNYHDLEEDSQDHSAPPWMTLFISLMLVLLTLFIFLTTFAKGDKRKVQTFREEFRKNLMVAGEGGKGKFAITDAGTKDDPVQHILNRMKSTGINKKLMDDFLTLKQIKDLEVRDGQRGLAIILPEVLGFESGGDGFMLTDKSRNFLNSITHLISELPYIVEVKGYATGKLPSGKPRDALAFSAFRAHLVYRYILDKDVAAIKLKVSGCGDAFEDSGVPQDKVEIIFKSVDL
jgi:flagellar motor protein MotB